MGEISQSIKVNGVRATALFDSGATENYLSTKLADKLSLRLGKKYAFQGIDGVRNSGRLSYVWVDVRNRGGSTRVVVTDLLPQDGYDIILGQAFLQDNEVLLNFKKEKFSYGERQPKMRRIGRI
jgi:hypothetical protein